MQGDCQSGVEHGACECLHRAEASQGREREREMARKRSRGGEGRGEVSWLEMDSKQLPGEFKGPLYSEDGYLDNF